VRTVARESNPSAQSRHARLPSSDALISGRKHGAISFTMCERLAAVLERTATRLGERLADLKDVSRRL